MQDVVWALLFGWKPVAAALVLSCLIGLVPNSNLRRNGLLALAAVPILLFVAIALAEGCLPASGKPQCAWVGWSLMFLPVQWLCWVGAVAVGSATRRLAVGTG